MGELPPQNIPRQLGIHIVFSLIHKIFYNVQETASPRRLGIHIVFSLIHKNFYNVQETASPSGSSASVSQVLNQGLCMGEHRPLLDPQLVLTGLCIGEHTRFRVFCHQVSL